MSVISQENINRWIEQADIDYIGHYVTFPVFWREVNPNSLMRDVSSLKGHNGNGDYEIIVSDTKNIEYIMSLIKQAL